MKRHSVHTDDLKHMEKKSKKEKTSKYSIKSDGDVQRLIDELRHNEPILQLHCDKKHLPAPALEIKPQTSILQLLMFPLTPETFMSQCFRNKAVHIKSDDQCRANDIRSNYMFNLDVKQIFQETSSENIFLWIPSQDSENGERLQSIELSNPDTAYLLHKKSLFASYCRAPPELEQPLVSQMLKDTGFGCGQYDPADEKMTLARGEVETFIGTPNHLTNWHTDFQENFTIQLSGRKKWTLKQGTVRYPLRGTTPHYLSAPDVIENQIKAARLSNPEYKFGMILDSNSYGNEVEIVMDPGDVLYFPAGMWHKVETLDYGVSINISLMGSNYADVFCKALKHELLKREGWREVVCNGPTTSGSFSNKMVVEKLDHLLSTLPTVIRELHQSGFAHAIFPPFIRDPPIFRIDLESGDKNNDDELESSADGNIDYSDSEEDEVNGKQQSTDENIVDINDFIDPNGTNAFRGDDEYRIVKNPLASLIRMQDVQPCKALDQFILNLNFGGSDTHESSVRVIFRDSTGILDRWCSYEEGKISEQSMESLLIDPPYALIYYGYLVCLK